MEEGNRAVGVVLMSFLILVHREAGATFCLQCFLSSDWFVSCRGMIPD